MKSTVLPSGVLCGWLMLLIGAGAAAEPPINALSPEELDAGWILLFDGETTFGWKATSDADWQVRDGAIAVSHGPPGWLHTTSQFADYELRVDFRAPPSTNSGVFLRSPSVPADPAGDCYELNIAGAEVSPFTTGSFVARQKAELPPPGDGWHTLAVVAEAGHFRVELDGQRALDYADPKPLRRGHVGLQFNRGPVAFRNVKLRPLGMSDLLGGSAEGLSRWHEFPGKAARFTWEPEGRLHVSGGNGQLETRDTFGDFLLQFEALVNRPGLNSGVFFRNVPGSFWQGYESQIHNGFRNGDRSQPVDCGTGGFYRRQSARRVAADDGEWFRETLVVTGDHMAAWVNGVAVSDWTDTRPADPNPRQGLRLEAGTLALQAHDPTTDVYFRRMRVAETAGSRDDAATTK